MNAMFRLIVWAAAACTLFAAANSYAQTKPNTSKSETFVKAVGECVGISRNWDRWKARVSLNGWTLVASRKGAWGKIISLRKNEILLNGHQGPFDDGSATFHRCEVLGSFQSKAESTDAIKIAETSIKPIGRSPDVATVILANGERVRFVSSVVGREFIASAVLFTGPRK